MLDVLEKVAIRFSTPEFRPTVTAIQVVNEPASWLLNMDKVRQFYNDAYSIIRKHNSQVKITFHDAFIGIGSWRDLATKPNVILDTHIYNVFDKSLVTMTQEMHLRHTCNFVAQLAASKALAPTITGEWSLATTDCTLHLNGFMKGSRYVGNFIDHSSPRLDPTYDFNTDKCAQYDSVDKFPKGHEQFLRRFFDRQISVYENAGSGWFFWNFKAENSPEWNFIMGVQRGWISLPATTTNTC
ncbi:hypothetical protein DSO57_1034569 [Entomophthora muscae]|uniref:Uncharacterized protein n=1 Tax=Entomophthora muscae TaxID=34485 RepID=A0ACC2S1R3_9FUNG|nr:hypothetical protein DSO57_1034569 [Entomophthora muscae]